MLNDVMIMKEYGLESYFSFAEAQDVLNKAKLAGEEVTRATIGHAANELLCSEQWHCKDSNFNERLEAASLGISAQQLREYSSQLADAEIKEVCRVLRNAREDCRTVFSDYVKNLKNAVTISKAFQLFKTNAYGNSYKWWSTAILLIEAAKERWQQITLEAIKVFQRIGYNVGVEIDMLLEEGGPRAVLMGCNNASVFRLIKRMKAQKLIVPAYVKEAAGGAVIEVPDNILRVSEINYNNSKTIHTVKGWLFPAEIKLAYAAYGVTGAVRKYSGMPDVPKAVCSDIFRTGGLSIQDAIQIQIPGEMWPIHIPRTWESYALVAWLKEKVKTSSTSLLKDRVVYGPEGQSKHFRYLDILDELRPEDLVNGVKTKPDVAFKNAAYRRELQLQAEMGSNVALPNAPWKDNASVRQIIDSDSLKEEGEKQSNCVAGYFKACLAGRCFIYHVEANSVGATMEINEAGTVFQLYEAGNVPARKELVDAVNAWAKSNKIKLDWKAQLA